MSITTACFSPPSPITSNKGIIPLSFQRLSSKHSSPIQQNAIQPSKSSCFLSRYRVSWTKTRAILETTANTMISGFKHGHLISGLPSLFPMNSQHWASGFPASLSPRPAFFQNGGGGWKFRCCGCRFLHDRPCEVGLVAALTSPVKPREVILHNRFTLALL